MKYKIKKFQHPTPTKPQQLSHHWAAPNYRSAAPQLAHPINDSPALNPYESINIEQLVGYFLYYSCTVDQTMLVTLNSISSEQSKITQKIAKKMVQLVNYASTHPEEITRYHTSRMIILMNINSSFLSEIGSKIISGGYHYLSSPSKKPNPPHTHTPYTQWNHSHEIHHNKEFPVKCYGRVTGIIIC